MRRVFFLFFRLRLFATALFSHASFSERPDYARPEIEIDGVSTRVLVEQLGAVDVNRLGDLTGHLTPEEQWGVDSALLTVFGLN
ncbi:hypothetical protein BMS3Abin02_00647 [bacterium BMS3Abin02]|nr:hypothetical protein BMS3Abin02_00647 [bacterium BMS3Abin02]